MNLPCKELKRISRGNLSSHYSVPMGAFAASALLTALIEMPFSSLQNEQSTTLQTTIYYIARFIIQVLAMNLSFGELKLHLNMARKKEYSLMDLFHCFMNRSDRYLLFALFLSVVTIAPFVPFVASVIYTIGAPSASTVFLSILLGAAGAALAILLQIEFQMLYFVITDHEEMEFADAIRLSRQLIHSNRGRLFYMYCSFIGMLILGLISFGIGLLWVLPYQKQTLANLYLNITGELAVPDRPAPGMPQQYYPFDRMA